ncbi:MAG: glycosyltransferase family 39 protein [Candidatus Sumerlaeaceae bacterium]|nr:glycosyltransferase family 39 protein [Candidatus Sumerlaeaceae bacterium]
MTGEALPGKALRALAAVIITMGLARLVAVVFGAPFFDEILYVWIGHNNPLNFQPHPPGTPLLGLLGTSLLGRTDSTLRVLPWLLGFCGPVLMYMLARSVTGSAAAAFWAVVVFCAIPMFNGFGIILTPDGPQLLLWILMLLLTWKAINSGRKRWWILVGAVAGLALYFKYIAVLYWPCLLLCLLILPQWRRQLRTAGPWLALVSGIFVFAPVALTVESANGWNSIRYHLEGRQKFVSPDISRIGEYFGLHFVHYSPIIYLGLLSALIWALHAAWKRRDEKLVFLGSFSVPVFAFFALITSVTARRLSREQWDSPAYVAALILLIIMVRELWNPVRARKLLIVCIAAMAIGYTEIALILFEGSTGLISRTMGIEPPFDCCLGFREMDRETDRQLAELPNGERKIFFGADFQLAMTYWYYSHNHVPYYGLSKKVEERYGVKEALKRWGIAEECLASQIGANAVFVEEFGALAIGEQRTRKAHRLNRLAGFFNKVEFVKSLEIPFGGRITKQFEIYRCYGLKPPPWEDGP